jgi:hypothetical protein
VIEVWISVAIATIRNGPINSGGVDEFVDEPRDGALGAAVKL